MTTPRLCSIADTLAVVGEKYSLLVLREVFFGVRRFDDMARNIGAPRDVLAARLKHLVEAGLLEKVPYSGRRFEYHPTPAGQELRDVLHVLRQWGDRHLVDRPPVVFEHSCGSIMDPAVVCRSCGHTVAEGSLRVVHPHDQQPDAWDSGLREVTESPAAGAEEVSATYRRSAGSARGEARRRELLERVTDDLAANGLVDFSLRRAARAAGATHKVLLYHFDGVDDLLRQAIVRLRERRIGNALAAASGSTLADRIREVWRVLERPESGLRVLDQAIGLAMYDPGRYGELGREASRQYLPTLLSFCPPGWPEHRKLEVSQLVLATLRGLLVELNTSGDEQSVEAGFQTLVRALEREEAATA
ncbi:winged helix-turn-helix transcriptional regulator [Nonomuraea sp. NPDC050536]|uniref:winged helix-turn-helix transcriptional regulator n=1 Tax=Nonomuraea sp. NPDC050536 TaxID=3364366 RepID=UPI0037C6898D